MSFVPFINKMSSSAGASPQQSTLELPAAQQPAPGWVGGWPTIFSAKRSDATTLAKFSSTTGDCKATTRRLSRSLRGSNARHVRREPAYLASARWLDLLQA
jgi:hypothetical protein